jgi:hypothetical protein
VRNVSGNHYGDYQMDIYVAIWTGDCRDFRSIMPVRTVRGDAVVESASHQLGVGVITHALSIVEPDQPGTAWVSPASSQTGVRVSRSE